MNPATPGDCGGRSLSRGDDIGSLNPVIALLLLERRDLRVVEAPFDVSLVHAPPILGPGHHLSGIADLARLIQLQLPHQLAGQVDAVGHAGRRPVELDRHRHDPVAILARELIGIAQLREDPQSLEAEMSFHVTWIERALEYGPALISFSMLLPFVSRLRLQVMTRAL